LITFTNLPLDLTGKAMLRQMEGWENEVVLELSMFFLFEINDTNIHSIADFIFMKSIFIALLTLADIVQNFVGCKA
jgi:hypothetical protein